LIETYTTNLSSIKIILAKAEIEKTEWYEVVDEFNKRFNIPFEI
jgi:hypothetical protein